MNSFKGYLQFRMYSISTDEFYKNSEHAQFRVRFNKQSKP